MCDCVHLEVRQDLKLDTYKDCVHSKIVWNFGIKLDVYKLCFAVNLGRTFFFINWIQATIVFHFKDVWNFGI